MFQVGEAKHYHFTGAFRVYRFERHSLKSSDSQFKTLFVKRAFRYAALVENLGVNSNPCRRYGLCGKSRNT